jgi:hypothetical protein
MIRRVIIAAILAAVTARADMEWETAIGQNDQVTSGLVAYWAMRNSGTTVYDEWTGGLNGGASNGVTFATTHAAVGYGASFDGTNDYILIADTSGSISAISISLWIKTSVKATVFVGHKYNSAVDKRTLGIFTRNTTGAMEVFASTDGTFGADKYQQYKGSVDVCDGNWHHFVVTWSAGTMKFYTDGAEDTGVTKTIDGAITTLFGSNTPIVVGATGVPGLFFSGLLDEYRWYNVALTADEVKQLYRMGAIPKGIK